MGNYAITEGSDSGHCCFDYTVVNMSVVGVKHAPEAVCETFTKEDAEMICGALNAILPPEAMQQLKELRMYHWREFERFRALQKIAMNAMNKTEEAAFKRGADIHMRACQALNNVLPGSGEYDCAEIDNAIRNA